MTSAKIEIFRRGHSTPLWSQTNANFDLASGTLDYNGAATALRLFPKGFLNVEHGPYKLKITIEGPARPGFTEAFTYFDVVIHSITLTWGKYNQLRRRRKSISAENVDTILGVKNSGIKGYEELAFDSITNLNPAPGPGLQHKVALTCNIFAKKPPGTMEIEEYVQRDDFTLYRDLWGAGARIPILAKVLVKKADRVTRNRPGPRSPSRLPPALGLAGSS